DSVELDSPGEAPGVAVGDYAIDAVQANGTGVGNYTITFDEIGILTVEALGVLIEIQVETLDQTKTYGDGTFALDETEGVGWVINGSTPFIGGDGIDSIELTSAGEAVTAAVGVYSIEAGAVTGTGLDNYNIDIVITESGVLTVVPLAIDLTITTLDQAKTYGTSFSLDETEGVGWVQTGSGGFVNGDALTGVILSSDGAAADADATAVVGAPYEIEVAGLLGPGINNYTITFENDGELTVFRAPLEISTLDQTKTFGDDTFALAETEGAGWEVSSGTIFFDGDITGVTLDSEGEAPLADAGVFAIDAGPASGDGVGNYDITFQEVGRLTVEELEVVLDVEIDTLNQTKTYGDADFTLAETEGTGWVIVGDDPFLGDDGITTIDLASEGEAVTAGVGIYDIIAGEISGTGLENYEITVNAVGTLTVDPRAIDLTVTTLDQVKTYGVDFALNDAEGVGWVTSGEGGFVNGDALTGVVLSSDATVATAPATDAIGDAALIEVVELLGPGIENYTITFANEGALTVLRAPLEITTLDQTKEFGDETFALAETEGAGWAITDGTLFNNDVIGTIELSSEGEAETAPVGTFDITTGDINGFGLENYDIALVADGVLTVDPRVISILVRTLDQAKTYGEAEFALAETEGLGWVIAEGAFEDGDGIDLVPLGSDGEAVTAAAGVYDIFQDGDIEGSGLSNYDIDVSTTGELTVAQAPLTITANDQSKVEGEALTFDGTEFTVTGLLDINDDAVTSVDLFSAGADAEASADDSPFEIALSNPVGRGLSNYAITEESGSLTVAAEDDRPDVIVPPRQPNLPTQGDTRITDGNGGDSGAIGGGTTSTEGTVATQTGAQSIEVAESVLAVIDRASSDLEAAVSSCRESDLLVTDFLGCVSASLDTFSASLDPANLDLPQELASVSAAVIVARQGVDAARARAVSRLAGVTDQAERRQIELDAVAEARSALQTAGAEVTKAIGLLRADDPELASVYRAQADTVIAALNSVEVDLQRAVGL
ncbi:MAG: MBG domain-containing protein, partial [Pseudomonadota bacterium]